MQRQRWAESMHWVQLSQNVFLCQIRGTLTTLPDTRWPADGTFERSRFKLRPNGPRHTSEPLSASASFDYRLSRYLRLGLIPSSFAFPVSPVSASLAASPSCLLGDFDSCHYGSQLQHQAPQASLDWSARLCGKSACYSLFYSSAKGRYKHLVFTSTGRYIVKT
jgi:hypothetical protein